MLPFIIKDYKQASQIPGIHDEDAFAEFKITSSNTNT